MQYTGCPPGGNDSMKNATKGALFSALLFPGLGQIILKRYVRGSVIAVTVLAAVSLFIVKAVKTALTIVDRLDLESGSVSMNDINDAAIQATAVSANLLLNITLVVILLCWIFSTIDAYRIGRKMDLLESQAIDTGT